jgi:hypothetical protein
MNFEGQSLRPSNVAACHPERSEGSRIIAGRQRKGIKMFRFAQHDSRIVPGTSNEIIPEIHPDNPRETLFPCDSKRLM